MGGRELWNETDLDPGLPLSSGGLGARCLSWLSLSFQVCRTKLRDQACRAAVRTTKRSVLWLVSDQGRFSRTDGPAASFSL